MIIELKGVEFDNKGSALMLHSIVKALTTRYPDVEFALSKNAKSPATCRHKIAKYRKITLRKLFFDVNACTYYFPRWISRLLKSFGIVGEGQVDAIIDASGFAYSDQWSPYMSIYHLAGEIFRCAKAGKPYIFLPQAFGPFSDKRCRQLLARSLPHAALVSARDNRSYEYLSAITGELPSLIKAKDFTNAITLSDFVWPVDFSTQPKACIVVNCNMTTTKNKDKGWMQSYIPLLQRCIDWYHEHGLQPFFLNHEGQGDGQMIAHLNNQLSTPLIVLSPEDALTVKQIIASSDAVFSSRFHGCVSALSSGIPCVGTSWSHKYEALYADYEASELLLDSQMCNATLDHILSVSISKDMHHHVRARAQHIRHETDRLWQRVFTILEQTQSHEDVNK